MADFESAIKKVLVSEGGYVNDPDDKGGETKHGISKRSYPKVDIKNLTVDGAKAIYKKDYWNRVNGDKIIDNDVAYEIFDTAVNMGVKTSSRLAQMVADTHPDGIIGTNSINAINSIDKELFVLKFKLAKIARYAYIVKRNPTNKKFLFGWINRVLGA